VRFTRTKRGWVLQSGSSTYYGEFCGAVRYAWGSWIIRRRKKWST
jgi:hypothetical protein